MGFKPYRCGFVGCLAEEESYVYFTFSRRIFKAIKHYPQRDFESLAHFMTSLHKFVTLRFFLRRPLPLRCRDSHYLEALGRHLAVLLTPDAFCSLEHIAPCCPGKAIDSDHPPQTHPATVLTAMETPPASHRLV